MRQRAGIELRQFSMMAGKDVAYFSMTLGTPTIQAVHLGLDPDGNLVETTEFDYNTIVYGFSPL